MLYRVKNLSDKPLFMDWTKTLLSDEQLAEYMEYEEEVFKEIGKSNDQGATTSRNRVRIADLIKEWVLMVQLGEFKTEINKLTRREERVARLNPQTRGKEYIPMYKLDAKGEDIVNDRQIENFRKFERKPIEQELKPGQETPSTHYEGFLEIKEISIGEEDQMAKDAGFEPETLNLDAMSFRELRDQAAAMGVTVPFGTSKDKLVELLKSS